MTTIFENKDFSLKLTGHDYDFVGTIEAKEKPLTFFFDEETDDEGCIYEDETRLLDVYSDVKPYDENDDGLDEAEQIAMDICAMSYFTVSPERGVGFLSDCKERGQFLALVKNYCPEQLKNIFWA